MAAGIASRGSASSARGRAVEGVTDSTEAAGTAKGRRTLAEFGIQRAGAAPLRYCGLRVVNPVVCPSSWAVDVLDVLDVLVRNLL